MTAGIEAAESTALVDGSSIVVGHDGSPGADQALAEALALARSLSARVVVVRAWSLATAPRPVDWKFGYTSGLEEYAEAVRLALVDDTRIGVKAFRDVPVEYRGSSRARRSGEVSR